MTNLSKQSYRKAVTEGYASQMNNTKWKEICFAFSTFEKLPAWRTLDFLNGYLSEWDCEWFHHVGPDYCSIEWLEIDPRESTATEVREVLLNVGVPFEEEDKRFKIIAYKK